MNVKLFRILFELLEIILSKFSEKDVILVTGASSGIGQSVSIQLVSDGATVVGIGRNSENLKLTKESCVFPDKFIALQLDLVNEIDNLKTILKDLVKLHGKFSGLVLSAGIQDVIPLRAIDVESSKRLFDINFFVPLILIQAFADKRIAFSQSSIVCISSVASIRGDSALSAYASSKGALNSLVKSLAVELAPNIRVNAVLPGVVKTKMIENQQKTGIYDDEKMDLLSSKHLLGLGKPSQVAKPVSFLLSEEASWITGQCICVDGGWSVR